VVVHVQIEGPDPASSDARREPAIYLAGAPMPSQRTVGSCPHRQKLWLAEGEAINGSGTRSASRNPNRRTPMEAPDSYRRPWGRHHPESEPVELVRWAGRRTFCLSSVWSDEGRVATMETHRMSNDLLASLPVGGWSAEQRHVSGSVPGATDWDTWSRRGVSCAPDGNRSTRV